MKATLSKKTIGLAFILIVCAIPIFSQKTISIQTDSIHALDFIQFIKENSNTKLYFDKEWFNSRHYSKVNIINKDPEKALKEFLYPLGFSVFTYQECLFITQGKLLNKGFANNYYAFIKDKSVEYNKVPKITKNVTSAILLDKREPVRQDLKTIRFGYAANSKSANYIVSGRIIDAETQEPIIGCTVILKGTGNGAVTDIDGRYKIKLPAGKNLLEYHAIGKEKTERRILLYANGLIDIDLDNKVEEIQMVNIYANRQNVVNSMTGARQLKVEFLRKMPAILGEIDVVKSLLTMPGIQTATEVSSGFNVRGGNNDQNLVLLDGAPVMNTSHFFGFFSVFPSDVLQEATLYKSGIPAEYGGRIASIFNLSTISKTPEKLKVKGGISPITSRLTVKTPLLKNKLSLILNGRTTYSNYILKKVSDARVKNSKASFNDFFGSATWTISDNEQLKLSLYRSDDYFKFDQITTYEYTNTLAALNYTKQLNPKWSSHANLSYSKYDFNLTEEIIPATANVLKYNIEQLSLKTNLKKQGNKNQEFSTGVKSVYYHTNPGNIVPFGDKSLVEPQKLEYEQGIETALFANKNFKIWPRLTVSLGARLNSFTNIGPKTTFSYFDGALKNQANIKDTATYKSGQLIKFYLNPEVRLLSKISTGAYSSIKFGYDRTVQYISQISNTVSPAPNDIWKLTDTHFKPQTANQFSVGYFKDIKLKAYDRIGISAEIYYRATQNMIDYKVGSKLYANNHFETEVIFGQNKSYGIEIQIERSTGRLSGWINYAYSRSLNKFSSKWYEETINEGDYFPSNYDKPHSFKSVLNYDFFERLRLSTNINFSSGQPVTLPAGVIQFAGAKRIFFNERNMHRMPNYFRVDLSGSYETTFKKSALVHSSVIISVVNLFGRKNPYSVFFQYDNRNQLKGYHMSVFGMPILTVTYNFTF